MTDYKKISGNRIDAFFSQQYFDVVEKEIYNSHYEIFKVKDCIWFMESGSRPTGGVSQYEDGVLSLGGEHVNNKCEIEIKTEKYIPFNFHKTILKTTTEINDILLVKDGATTGKVAIIEDEKHANQNINEHVFMLKVNEKINPLYLTYFLHSKAGQIQIERGITGATVTGITKDIVKNLLIPIPSPQKQYDISKNIKSIRKEAKNLQREATKILEIAKIEIENIILGH